MLRTEAWPERLHAAAVPPARAAPAAHPGAEKARIVSPLVMSVLLLKVSGVGLLEKDIGTRRPAYRDYVARTNAFFPGPPRRPAG